MYTVKYFVHTCKERLQPIDIHFTVTIKKRQHFPTAFDCTSDTGTDQT